MKTSAPLTTTLHRVPGFEVLAKLHKGTPIPMTFANRTQAERHVAELGEPWAVRNFGARPFYVSRELAAPSEAEIAQARTKLLEAGFTEAEIETETGLGLRRLPNCPPVASIAVKVAAGALSLTGARHALTLSESTTR